MRIRVAIVVSIVALALGGCALGGGSSDPVVKAAVTRTNAASGEIAGYVIAYVLPSTNGARWIEVAVTKDGHVYHVVSRDPKAPSTARTTGARLQPESLAEGAARTEALDTATRRLIGIPSVAALASAPPRLVDYLIALTRSDGKQVQAMVKPDGTVDVPDVAASTTRLDPWPSATIPVVSGPSPTSADASAALAGEWVPRTDIGYKWAFKWLWFNPLGRVNTPGVVGPREVRGGHRRSTGRGQVWGGICTWQTTGPNTIRLSQITWGAGIGTYVATYHFDVNQDTLTLTFISGTSQILAPSGHPVLVFARRK